MKRILLIALTLIMLLSCFSCDKKASGSGEKEGKFKAWTTHLTDKQIANVEPEDVNEVTEYHVYMTRGETEGCQLVVHSPKTIKRASLSFNVRAHESSNLSMQAFVMDHVHRIKRRDWTDSAIPYYGKKMTLEANQIVPYIVEFTTTKDTPAGEYVYDYEFIDTETDEIHATFKVTVHVWDIVLPEDKTFATSVGINAYHVERYDPSEDGYKRFYDILLEHNLSGHRLPYDILDSRADEYMSDPRVTSFCVGLFTADTWDDETVLKYYNKLKQDPVWLKKALFYIVDEPTSSKEFNRYKEVCERFARLCPEIPVIAPFYTNVQTGASTDQVDAMAPYTVLWCPKLCLWDDKWANEDLNYTPRKSFADRMKEFQAEGDKVWSYVCNNPIMPYAQLFIDTEGIVHRLLMWQHYQRDIEGFLYWQTVSWGYTGHKDVDPWKHAYNGVDSSQGAVYGEGYLLYPGQPVAQPGAVPSIRLKILRDGIDDIEFLYLAEKYLGKDEVMKKVKVMTPSLTEYTSEENFYKIRKEIGDALEAAMKNAE